MSTPRRAEGMPRLPEVAWYGPIGQAVLATAGYHEADPVGVLVQMLALFGVLAGLSPHVLVGGIAHRARIWPMIIGSTSSGRKGTALHEAKWLSTRISDHAARYLAGHRLRGALSSSEGLLTALGAAGPPKDPDAEQPGGDGVLLCEETEFGRILNVLKRDGNTLGELLRQLWEEDSAGTATRQNPLHVDHAHLTVIGHISPGELKLKLAAADVLGGTVNRFLMIAVKRTQLISRALERPDLVEMLRPLRDAADLARAARLVRLDRRAADLWDEAYVALNDDEPEGQLGAVLARGPAYVQRLAMIYALADGSSLITPAHLLAALGLWSYAAASARQVFDDPRDRNRSDEARLADYLAGARRRSATDINRDLFGGNKDAEDIKRLVVPMLARGDVTEELDRETGGRPTRWLMWTGAARDALAELIEKYRYGYGA